MSEVRIWFDIYVYIYIYVKSNSICIQPYIYIYTHTHEQTEKQSSLFSDASWILFRLYMFFLFSLALLWHQSSITALNLPRPEKKGAVRACGVSALVRILFEIYCVIQFGRFHTQIDSHLPQDKACGSRGRTAPHSVQLHKGRSFGYEWLSLPRLKQQYHVNRPRRRRQLR